MIEESYMHYCYVQRDRRTLVQNKYVYTLLSKRKSGMINNDYIN